MKASRSKVTSTLPPIADYVDEQLLEIARSFDWLRIVSPCATEELWKDFRAAGFRGTPAFRYRDPAVDIATAREHLLALPVRDIEMPVLKALLTEKQRELDRQLELIELRETDGFLQASIDLFGTATPSLHADAMHILEVVETGTPLGVPPAGPDALTRAAHAQFDYYRRRCPAFAPRVRRSRNIPAGMMVINDTLIISEFARVPRDRVDALLHHEIGTHILSWHNGGQQPLRQLQCGLAHYDEMQEGLGVLAEYLSGNLSPLRLRTLAARVVAVRLMTDGASFSDVFNALRKEHRFSARAAFVITTRVFRGGGLTKDVVYLRGLKHLLAYLREGHPFEQLLVGKFALSQLNAIHKLDSLGQLRRPRLLPAYLHNAAAQQRLSDCTKVPLDGLYQRLVA